MVTNRNEVYSLENVMMDEFELLLIIFITFLSNKNKEELINIVSRLEEVPSFDRSTPVNIEEMSRSNVEVLVVVRPYASCKIYLTLCSYYWKSNVTSTIVFKWDINVI